MAEPRAVLEAALELVLGRGRLGEERADGLELVRKGHVRRRCDGQVPLLQVVARPGERQRLQRLGRRAQVADETGVAGGRDDLPVADRDRVDEVDGLDGRPAADDYPERLQESEA